MSTGVAPLNTPPAHIPPANVEAEESVLGAMLLAGGPTMDTLVDQLRETGLRASSFYTGSLGRIYDAALELHGTGQPVDPITLPDLLEKKGILEEVGGRVRVHELAALVPSISNAPHYARLVIEAAQLRGLIRVGAELSRLGFERPGETSELLRLAAAHIETLTDAAGAGAHLEPLWIHEAMHEEIPAQSEYVENVLQAGVLADIVGLPYLHKTAVALELAAKIAAGTGDFLGRWPIRKQAPVAYLWGDDSRPQELKRIQDYSTKNDLGVLPLGFYLNPPITLPEGIPALKSEIRRHGYRLVVVDSLYNFAPGIDWIKDTVRVASLYASLKRLCDDIEGLTILLVDHAAKPSDSNRGRDVSVASYGSVWKAAAVRCSIVITKEKGSLYAAAVGNNIRGFPKTPVRFDQDTLELRIVTVHERDPQADDDLDKRVLEHVVAHPGQSTNKITTQVKGRGSDIRAALARLEEKNLISDTYGSSSQLLPDDPGRTGRTLEDGTSEVRPDGPGTRKPKTAWIPLEQAVEVRPEQNGTNPDEVHPGTVEFAAQTSSQSPPLYVVEGDLDEPAGSTEEERDDRAAWFDDDPEADT